MIYLVRHGQTDWNLERRIQDPEIPLNETGKNEARICAQKLISVNIQRIISSDILRAKQTADIFKIFYRFQPTLMKDCVRHIGVIYKEKP